jgi:hypothetical protein
MRQSSLSLIVIVLSLILLVYGVLVAMAPAGWNKGAIAAKVESLTPQDEKKAVDTKILEKKPIQDVETLKIFGPRPVSPAPDSLNRSNPFDGI